MDYWLDHAVQGLVGCGYEVIIIHNNPAAALRERSGVRLYPEPLTGEDSPRYHRPGEALWGHSPRRGGGRFQLGAGI